MGHGYVDLGLPSGLKWATCNLGASKLQDPGNFYIAWGEISTKSDYDASNSITLGKSISELKSYGVIDSAGKNLSVLHDAAHANWNNTWRMPTKENFEELINCCKWIWIQQSEFRGYKIIGPNGKSIFIPSSGYRGGYYFDHKDGIYWSSTPDSNDDNKDTSYCLYFDNSNQSVGTSKRSGGRSVRAVSE